ncbi:hypothetical protein KSS87_001143, partial [Heliosperma pusillum]
NKIKYEYCEVLLWGNAIKISIKVYQKRKEEGIVNR